MRFVDLYHRAWQDVPVVVIDTETTGPLPGVDRAVQVGLARFEGGKFVDGFESLVYPGIPIGLEAFKVHGISDEDVASERPIGVVFEDPTVQRLLKGAQPCAYNAEFDRWMVPPFGDDPRWPWLDALVAVRVVDRWVKGKGRHQLGTAAARHGVKLDKAHSALADAKAAGELFYKLAPQVYAPRLSLGQMLRDQRRHEADQWSDFQSWLANQPPQGALPGV